MLGGGGGGGGGAPPCLLPPDIPSLWQAVHSYTFHMARNLEERHQNYESPDPLDLRLGGRMCQLFTLVSPNQNSVHVQEAPTLALVC